MSINSNDLREICLIVNKRNELQKVRNSARTKAVRLNWILTSKREAAKRKKLETLASKDTNKYYKLLRKFQEHSNNHFPDFDSKRAFNDFMHQFHCSAEKTYLEASKELQNDFKYRLNHPKKYDNISLHTVKMELQKVKAEREMAKYEIMLHTNKTTKKLRQLLKKNGMQQRSDGSGGVSSLVYNRKLTHEDGQLRAELTRIDANKIKEIAFDASIEKELQE